MKTEQWWVPFGKTKAIAISNIGRLRPTKSTLKRLHKELWLWSSQQRVFMMGIDNNHKVKAEWPVWDFLSIDFEMSIKMTCFACQACNDECEGCPIAWSGYTWVDCAPCLRGDSIYKHWSSTKDPLKFQISAEVIAFMDWK